MTRHQCHNVIISAVSAVMLGSGLGRGAEPAAVDLAGYGRLTLERPAGAEAGAAAGFRLPGPATRRPAAEQAAGRFFLGSSDRSCPAAACRRRGGPGPTRRPPPGAGPPRPARVCRDGRLGSGPGPALAKPGALRRAGGLHRCATASAVVGFLRSPGRELVLPAAERAGPGRGPHRYDAEPLEQTTRLLAATGYGHSFFGPYFGLDELADGAGHFFPHAVDDRPGRGPRRHRDEPPGTYAAPWWMRNRFPRDIVQWDPYAISGWNGLAAMAATHLSQHAADEAYAYAERFARQALRVAQGTAGDHLGCFREVAGGHPGDELALHHASTEFMDYDEAGQTAFRRWLREDARAGPGRAGPAVVRRPGPIPFLGRSDVPFALRVLRRLRPRQLGPLGRLVVAARQPRRPKPKAGPARLPPGRRLDAHRPGPVDETAFPVRLQAATPGCGRARAPWPGSARSSMPAAWLAEQPGGEVYLVAQVGDQQNEPVEVFFNGNYLGPIRPRTVQSGPDRLSGHGAGEARPERALPEGPGRPDPRAGVPHHGTNRGVIRISARRKTPAGSISATGRPRSSSWAGSAASGPARQASRTCRCCSAPAAVWNSPTSSWG